jgi:hypothetical protein
MCSEPLIDHQSKFVMLFTCKIGVAAYCDLVEFLRSWYSCPQISIWNVVWTFCFNYINQESHLQLSKLVLVIHRFLAFHRVLWLGWYLSRIDIYAPGLQFEMWYDFLFQLSKYICHLYLTPFSLLIHRFLKFYSLCPMSPICLNFDVSRCDILFGMKGVLYLYMKFLPWLFVHLICKWNNDVNPIKKLSYICSS